ncbi:TPA: MFS transporter [Citrobacter freundii]
MAVGTLSDRIGRRPVLLTGALVFALACVSMLFVTSREQYLVARFIQGTSICFISTVGYVSIQETFGEMDSIRIMAALTSIVLLAPVIGPVAGAALMTFIHWKWLFAILGAFGLVAWSLLLFKMPETIISQARGFKPGEVLCYFIAAFRHPVVLTGSLAVAFGNLPKGTVSATLNIMALGIIALSIEITRWVYFHAGGRIAFHGAAGRYSRHHTGFPTAETAQAISGSACIVCKLSGAIMQKRVRRRYVFLRDAGN